MEAAKGKQALDGPTRLALMAMALVVFVIANDFTALSVALPEIERDLGSNISSVQWVINAYALVFGVLIVTGGRLADMLGRRRMLFVGCALFAGGSIVAGAAPSVSVLIAARAVMAVGGALIWPATVGLTFSILPAAMAGLAGGLILGVSGIGNAFGPILGGFLTDTLSWRWVLFLNVPIAAAAVLVTRATVKPEPPSDRGERLDLAGVATLSLALVALMLALDESDDLGWGSPAVIALLATFVVALPAFVWLQRRGGERALVPPAVFANRRFAFACVATLLASGAFFSIVLYAPQFMQKVLGFSPLDSGLGFLPLMLCFAGGSFAGGPLYQRLGARPLLLGGSAMIPVGCFLVSLVDAGSEYLALVPGMVVFGIGAGFFYSTLTTAAVTTLDPSRSSLAGGIMFMFQLVGGSLGIGLTTAVFTASSAAAGGSAVDAFATGMSDGLRVSAAIACVAIAAVWVVIRPGPAGARDEGLRPAG
ncbi:MFS transporter [Thermoleophilia bacterium SCSIO 60948]|nr:MFS transporter [Thermoleophilia bacterium SCSIO 60948]